MDGTHGNEKVSDKEILHVFDESTDPFVSISELAEQLDMTRQALNYRLRSLEREGEVKSKPAGGNAFGWWRDDN